MKSFRWLVFILSPALFQAQESHSSSPRIFDVQSHKLRENFPMRENFPKHLSESFEMIDESLKVYEHHSQLLTTLDDGLHKFQRIRAISIMKMHRRELKKATSLASKILSADTMMEKQATEIYPRLKKQATELHRQSTRLKNWVQKVLPIAQKKVAAEASRRKLGAADPILHNLVSIISDLHGGSLPAGSVGYSAKFFDKKSQMNPHTKRVHVATVAPCHFRPVPLENAMNASRRAADLLNAPEPVMMWLDALDDLTKTSPSAVPSVGFGAAVEDHAAKIYVMNLAGRSIPDLPLGTTSSVHALIPQTKDDANGQMVALEWSLNDDSRAVRLRHYITDETPSLMDSEGARVLVKDWPATTENILTSTPFRIGDDTPPVLQPSKIGFTTGSGHRASSSLSDEDFLDAARLFYEELGIDMTASRAWLESTSSSQAAQDLQSLHGAQAGRSAAGVNYITLYRHPSATVCGVAAAETSEEGQLSRRLQDQDSCEVASDDFVGSLWAAAEQEGFDDDIAAQICPDSVQTAVSEIVAACTGCECFTADDECDDACEVYSEENLIFMMRIFAPPTCRPWNYDYLPEEPLCPECESLAIVSKSVLSTLLGPCETGEACNAPCVESCDYSYSYGGDECNECNEACDYVDYDWYDQMISYNQGSCSDSCLSFLSLAQCHCSEGDDTCFEYEEYCEPDDHDCSPYPSDSSEYWESSSSWAPAECFVDEYKTSLTCSSSRRHRRLGGSKRLQFGEIYRDECCT